ncbi:ion transporter [Stieleria varia]|uniref:Cyclic nucleotide-gated potassium channel n=1 Tax=Stieleria varia TaxID=2528005 RepID=A0A5C6B6Q4_9BACT|nr:ion transporter [Stieleria varia]TWU07638.1 Cyclic nucleotide-gated potassium channel [Stieleria varia]
MTKDTAKTEAPSRRRTQRPDGPPWRVTMHDIIFESDTFAGWVFDVALLVLIIISVVVVSLETVPRFAEKHADGLWIIECILTALFTIEYALRLISARNAMKYAFSFWGIIDLLSIVPTYFGLIWTGGTVQSFVIVRSIRLLRVFRVMKLWRMMRDADELSHAVWSARHKIVVFLAVIMVSVTISGTLMFLVETEFADFMTNADGELLLGENDEPIRQPSQFTSIPQSMYWAIVTMTTVGYGDVVPKTAPGKVISAALILLGYSLIIVPSGFVSAELTGRRRDESKSEPEPESDVVDKSNAPETSYCECDACGEHEHHEHASYCHRCGAKLP